MIQHNMRSEIFKAFVALILELKLNFLDIVVAVELHIRWVHEMEGICNNKL